MKAVFVKESELLPGDKVMLINDEGLQNSYLIEVVNNTRHDIIIDYGTWSRNHGFIHCAYNYALHRGMYKYLVIQRLKQP